MAQVDILIKTDGTSATSGELNNSQASIQSAVQTVQPQSVGSSRSLVARSVYANQLATAGINATKQGINYAKSNYGNFTGDYIAQQRIENTFNKIEGFVSLGTAVVGGALVHGPIGAAVGGIVSGISIISNAIQSGSTYNLNLSKANRQANFNSQRIGAILINGNR